MSSKNERFGRIGIGGLAVLAAVGILAGCKSGDAATAIPPLTKTAAQVPPASAPVSPPVTPPTDRPKFDKDKAFALLEKQCSFGPRPVGSEAHRKTRDFLLEEMKKYADTTVAQDFTYKDLPLTNIIGVFNPKAKRSVLLCAHWDTRPRADQEIDADKQKKPILGANDGASGVAILLEIARNFKEKSPEVGVIIVLLDGEDYGFFDGSPDHGDGVLLGAKHFAKTYRTQGYNPDFGILLDMVGDKDLGIPMEDNSPIGTNEKVFRIAREIGYEKYFLSDKHQTITDDHLPLIRAGIRCIDLIDFDYAAWHTLDDTPDKCSAESLGIVGNVVAEVVYREKGI